MIKILKPGTKKEVTCDKCGALLSYDENEDVKEECIEKAFATNMPSGYGRKQKYIICPQCKNKIVTWFKTCIFLQEHLQHALLHTKIIILKCMENAK